MDDMGTRRAPHTDEQLPECVAIQSTLTERLENALLSQKGILETQERLADVVTKQAQAQLLITSRLEMVDGRHQDEDAEKKKLAEEARAEGREVRGDQRRFSWQTLVALISAVLALTGSAVQILVLNRLAQIHP